MDHPFIQSFETALSESPNGLTFFRGVNESWSHTLSTNYARIGSQSHRVEARGDVIFTEDGTHRTFRIAGSSFSNAVWFRMNHEDWVGFSFLLDPNNYPTGNAFYDQSTPSSIRDDGRHIVWQLNGDNGPEFMMEFNGRENVFRFYRGNIGGSIRLGDRPVEKGVWIDVVISTYRRQSSDGRIRVWWKNETTPFVNFTGVTAKPDTNIPMHWGTYWSLGVDRAGDFISYFDSFHSVAGEFGEDHFDEVSPGGTVPPDPEPVLAVPGDFIIDNGDAGYSETNSQYWNNGTDASLWNGDERWTWGENNPSNPGGVQTAIYTATAPFAGQLRLWFRWFAKTDRATAIPWELRDSTAALIGGGTDIDQTQNNATWYDLGTYDIAAGAWTFTLSNEGIADFIGADALTHTMISSSAGNFVQEVSANDLVSMEAENYHSKSDGSLNSFFKRYTDETGYSGASAMQANPINTPTDDPYRWSTDYAQNAPRLDFLVDFTSTGTHYVWVRVWQTDSVTNSVHVGIDGGETTTGLNVGNTTFGEYTWVRELAAGGNATLTVPTAATHTINVWAREGGIIVDKVVLTTNSGYDPATENGGLGPDESTRATEPPEVPTVTVGTIAVSNVTETSLSVSISGDSADTAIVSRRIFLVEKIVNDPDFSTTTELHDLSEGTLASLDRYGDWTVDVLDTPDWELDTINDLVSLDGSQTQSLFIGSYHPFVGDFTSGISEITLDNVTAGSVNVRFAGFTDIDLDADGTYVNELSVVDPANLAFGVAGDSDFAGQMTLCKFYSVRRSGATSGTTFTFSNLTPNTLYSVLYYAIDTGGYTSSLSNRVETTTLIGQTPTPVITPNGGEFANPPGVQPTLTSADADNIWYTLDETDPTTSGTRVDYLVTPVPNQTATFTLRAYAVTSGKLDSSEASAIFTLASPPVQLQPPVISPNGGLFNPDTGVAVTLSSSESPDEMYWTDDESTPDTGDNAYSITPIGTLTETTTIKAIAVKAGLTDSDPAEATFTKSSQAAPVFSPPGGTYFGAVAVSMSKPGTKNIYTSDGTDPDFDVDGTILTGTSFPTGVQVATDAVLKGRSWSPLGGESSITSESYTILPDPGVISSDTITSIIQRPFVHTPVDVSGLPELDLLNGNPVGYEVTSAPYGRGIITSSGILTYTQYDMLQRSIDVTVTVTTDQADAGEVVITFNTNPTPDRLAR